MLWSSSTFSLRYVIETGSSLHRLSPFCQPLSSLIRTRFDQKCLQSSSSVKESSYPWAFVRPPAENQALFDVLLNGELTDLSNKLSSNVEPNHLSLPRPNLDNLVHYSGKMVDKNGMRSFHDKIINTIVNGNPNCLRQISSLLRNNFDYLISLRAPFDIHWNFIKKLDMLLVKYCESLSKDVWLKPTFIDESLQLTVDLYKFSPPTAMHYSDALFRNIIGNATNPTRYQFLLLMFCCIISRQRMDHSYLFRCQKLIDQHLESLSLAHLALILVAFHKTKSHLIDEHLYKKILIKVTMEAESERDATVRSSLLKGINYSLVMPDSRLSEQLVNAFLHLDNLSIYNYIHLGEFCINKRVYCPQLIDKSLGILENAIEHLREKDVERILKCATAFDHLQPPCPKIHKFIHQFDSTIEKSDGDELDKTIPSLLRSVFLIDIYPPNMINYVLSRDWMKRINFYGSDIHLFYWLLMTIRDCLMIEKHPEYVGKLQNLDNVFNKGSRIEQLRTPISRIINSQSRNLSVNLRNFGHLYKATVDAFPNRIVQLGYALSTSLTPDLMVTTLPKHIRLLKGPIRTPNCFTRAYIIVYQGKQMYVDQNYCQISGHYRLRERLLQRLGFTVINIPFYEIYHKTDEFGNNDDLVDYIKKRMNQAES